MRHGYRDDAETGDFAGERVFASTADIRYVLAPAAGPSKVLVVAFSSAQALGAPPRYRWRKQLSELPCHRLFVLDDHGPRTPVPGPSWYLGAGRSFAVVDSVCDLIERTAEEQGVKPEHTVTIGSSMGGWAALYFGTRVGAGDVIAGEPQTLLGTYLCGPAFHELAEHIVGGSSPEDRAILDGILFDALRASTSLPRVHLFCGRESPHHERHVLPLLEVLEELGGVWELELAEGFDHDDVGHPFSAYLLAQLDEALSGRAHAD
jgi:pimeloyl-ACP methyl ester carboxylesterase